MNQPNVNKLPLNEIVLSKVLKNKNIELKDADPDKLSEELSGSFINCEPDRIARMLESLDRPIVLCKSAASIDFDKTPSVTYYIDDLLTEGVTMINSIAKGGKSRLLLQEALEICKGGRFLGRNCHKTDVLYLALEDERIDFENRLQLFLRGSPAPDNLYYATAEDFNYQPPTLEQGQLITLLEENLKPHPEIKVILIDVFGVIRSKPMKGENFTDHERRDLQTLLRFAGKHPGLAIVIAHHVSKTGKRLGNLEAIGSGAGSYVISGTIHTEMLLQKGETERERVLSIEGRRIPSQKFVLLDDYPRWKYAGSKDDYDRANSPLYLTIKRILEENNGLWKGTYSQIIELNREYTNISNISKSLNKNTFRGATLNDLQALGIAYKEIKNGKGVLHEFKLL